MTEGIVAGHALFRRRAMMPERIVLLTEGAASLLAAKTATCVLRYRPADVIAVLDSSRAHLTASQAFGVGGDTPIISSLEQAEAPTTLMVGIAPAGGRVPESWRPILMAALQQGMRVVSGLHDFISDDPQFAEAARLSGSEIYDVRKNKERDLAKWAPLREECLRVLTVGQDCSLGKMLTAYELTRSLQQRGLDAKFVATGQTGIMLEGDGVPIDCIVSDFVNGAVEKMIVAQQHRDVLVVEGQATISHPAYSCVSAGLLHGARPHGMIMVYEAGREFVHGVEGVKLTPLPQLIAAYECLANLRWPSKVIAIAMNSRLFNDQEADAERDRVRNEFGLPVADPVRHGCDEIADAVQSLREEVLQAMARQS